MSIAFLSGRSADMIAQKLAETGHMLVATPGTQKNLEGKNYSVLPFTDLFPMPEGTDESIFKSVHPAFYSAILNGTAVRLPERITSGASSKSASITFVYDRFGDLDRARHQTSRPDIGGPLAAEVAAYAVLYHNRDIFAVGYMDDPPDWYRLEEDLSTVEFGSRANYRTIFLHYAERTLRNVARYKALVEQKL